MVVYKRDSFDSESRNTILLIVRVGIQSLEFFTELHALLSLSLLIRVYS